MANLALVLSGSIGKSARLLTRQMAAQLTSSRAADQRAKTLPIKLLWFRELRQRDLLLPGHLRDPPPRIVTLLSVRVSPAPLLWLDLSRQRCYCR